MQRVRDGTAEVAEGDIRGAGMSDLLGEVQEKRGFRPVRFGDEHLSPEESEHGAAYERDRQEDDERGDILWRLHCERMDGRYEEEIDQQVRYDCRDYAHEIAPDRGSDERDEQVRQRERQQPLGRLKRDQHRREQRKRDRGRGESEGPIQDEVGEAGQHRLESVRLRGCGIPRGAGSVRARRSSNARLREEVSDKVIPIPIGRLYYLSKRSIISHPKLQFTI